MTCKNCRATLPENETKCPACGAENANETEYISAAGAERVIPKGFSAKKNIIVIIIIAAVMLIGGIVTAVTVSNSAARNISASETLQLAERYLSEQNYEQAVIEFQKVLEIEPMNVEAYLGLADTYMALGETDKAVEILENGIKQTDSGRLKDKLAEIKGNSETSAKAFTTEAVITEPVVTETEAPVYGSMGSVTILGTEYDIATTTSLRIIDMTAYKNQDNVTYDEEWLNDFDVQTDSPISEDDLINISKLQNLNTLGLFSPELPTQLHLQDLLI